MKRTQIEQAMTDTLDKSFGRQDATPYEPRVFISGPMSGYKDYNKPEFLRAEYHLNELGYTSIRNPIRLDQSLSYRELINLCLWMLQDSDVLYLLDGWQKSSGAKLEHQYAVTTGMEIIYPEDRKEQTK